MRPPIPAAVRRPIIGTRTAITALVSALLVVAVLAAVVTVAARDGDPVVDRDDLRASSGRVVAAVFSVAAGSWKADRNRASALVTADFAESYGDLLQGPPQSGVRSVVWRPTSSSIIESGRDWGETLTAFDVVTTLESGEPVTTTHTLWVRLAESAGTWKLSRVWEVA